MNGKILWFSASLFKFHQITWKTTSDRTPRNSVVALWRFVIEFRNLYLFFEIKLNANNVFNLFSIKSKMTKDWLIHYSNLLRLVISNCVLCFSEISSFLAWSEFLFVLDPSTHSECFSSSCQHCLNAQVVIIMCYCIFFQSQISLDAIIISPNAETFFSFCTSSLPW